MERGPILKTGNLKFKHPEIPGGYKSTVLEILYAEKN